jgi:hypothetical protein
MPLFLLSAALALLVTFLAQYQMESLINFQKSSSTSRFSDSFIQKFLLFARNFQNILTLLYCVLICQNITDKIKKFLFFYSDRHHLP